MAFLIIYLWRKFVSFLCIKSWSSLVEVSSPCTQLGIQWWGFHHDHRRNEDVSEELQIVDINSRIKDYHMKWLQYLGRVEQNTFPKLLSDYKSRGKRNHGYLSQWPGYGMDGRGSTSGKGKRFFSTPQRSDRLWGPPSLLSNGYRELFPRR
jgi:hypothetical protein